MIEIQSSNSNNSQTTMRVFIIGFLVFLAFALSSRWYFMCELRHKCGDEENLQRPMTLSLKDGDQKVLEGYEQFGFAQNSFEVDTTKNNVEFLKKVAEYLEENQSRNMTITGRFLENEKQAKAGFYENIGIARARAVERLLEKMGTDEGRISIDYAQMQGTEIDEIVSFELITDSPNDYDKLAYKFEDNTFSDANFAFNSDEFKPGDQCILYADSVKIFLEENPEMLLSIIGHTDSIDTEKFNYNLGLRRAKSASKYFRELGVKSAIKVSSLGESQPVAPNSKPDGSDNPEGRQKNRRVNFKIIEKVLE